MTEELDFAAMRMSERCPSCRAPMVGTRPTLRQSRSCCFRHWRKEGISLKTLILELGIVASFDLANVDWLVENGLESLVDEARELDADRIRRRKTMAVCRMIVQWMRCIVMRK